MANTEKKIDFEFVPKDRITDFSYHLVEDLFEIEGPLLTNESSLHDFDNNDHIPGHWQRNIEEIPENEREHYLKDKPDFVEPERYYVWYPKVTSEEWTEINRASRERFFQRIETIYHIPIADYTGDDRLFVWEIAQFIEQRLKFT